jgi:hypothetical protein
LERTTAGGSCTGNRDTPDPDWAVLENGQAREFYHHVMAEVIYELQREFDRGRI